MLTPLSATQTVDRARSALQSGRGAGLPELLQLIQTLSVKVGRVTVAEIADLIEKDAAVMSRLLTVANTIVHNPNVAPMSSVPHAIHQVGFQRIRSLAVSLMLLENTGRVGNPPEQREAAAHALCAGLLAQGYATFMGTIDPEAAFAGAALRQFGYIILPAVSLEHYREARERCKAMAEDVAYRGMFGVTPLELSRRLLGSSHLPEEITRSLRDCEPEAVAAMPLSSDSRLLGIADLGCRLARLALDTSSGAAKFDARARELIAQYDPLLPGASDALAPALSHTDDRIASFTKCSGVDTLTLPGLDAVRARVSHSDPILPVPVGIAAAQPPATAPVASADAVQAPVGTASAATPASSTSAPAAPPAETPAPASAPAEPAWTDQLAHSAAFESAPAEAKPTADPWESTLALVRDNFEADECWVFLPQATGVSLPLRHGIGDTWRQLRATAKLRPDERTVFGVCLARRENVVIHDTAEASLAAYLPDWFRHADSRPGAFLLLPLTDGKAVGGLVLVGWKRAQRLSLGAARTELARQVLASACARLRSAA